MQVEKLHKRFDEYIEQNGLIEKGQQVLAACSGGVDSVLMCELFHRKKINFSIAHVNFGLRGEDSDLDEVFVKSLSEKYDVRFFLKSADTRRYAKKKGISLEMAARELRYEWFKQIVKKHDIHLIATAHHLNDHVETILLNLTRGTGIKGYHGILPKNGNVIRPLLCFSKEDILLMATHLKLNFREDKTNDDPYFQRNRIRHNVVPELKKINPSLESVFYLNAQRSRENEKIIGEFVENRIKKWVKKEKDHTLIDIQELRKDDLGLIWLKKYLSGFGFSEAQVENIATSINRQPGALFYSGTHILNKDRDCLIIEAKKTSSEKALKIEQTNKEYYFNQIRIKTRITDKNNLPDKKDPNRALLDYHKLEFPLTLRIWKEGDYFIPYGMRGKKKISDYLTDLKLPLVEKKNIPVLLSGGKLVWVVGYRIDDRFKVNEELDQKIFELEIIGR